MKIRYLAVSIAVGAVGLAACGSDNASSSKTPATSSAAGTPSAGEAVFNVADVEFAQGMIPHHEQGVEMANMALDPMAQAGPKVLDLAARIKSAQNPEIQLMTGWLTTWGRPMQMDTGGGHKMSTLDGMMTDGEMNDLASKKGAEFDTMWMEMMISHHEGAIARAQAAKAAGSDPDVLDLADQIIAAQQAEIAEMQQLLAG